MKNILLVASHLDDVEIAMSGTILKLNEEPLEYNYTVITVCDGDVPNRSSDDHQSRLKVFEENMRELNIHRMHYLHQTSNNLEHVDKNRLIGQIEHIIHTDSIDTVFTQNKDDINIDHGVTSSIVRVATRPRVGCPVKLLAEWPIPGSTEWSGVPFEPNLIFSLEREHLDKKLELIKRYKTEVRPAPDPLSLDNIRLYAGYLGGIYGASYAEVFRVIYQKF